MCELFFTPAAQARAARFRLLGMAPDDAAIAAIHPLASRMIGQLRLASLITGPQWFAARMLETAWHDMVGPAAVTSQSQTLAAFAEYGVRISSGRRVAGRVEASAEDEDVATVAGGHTLPVAWGGLSGGDTLFERTVQEFATRGMTPNVTITVAHGAVQEECGGDSWRLLDALLMAGGLVPRNATLAMLRAALDTTYATLQPNRYGIGMSARECHLLNRDTARAA